MKNYFTADPRRRAPVALALLWLTAGAGCDGPRETRWQGYLEAEFVYVAAPLAGQLEKLHVREGTRVEVGARLFTLERSAELAARRQAAGQLLAAEARLADLRKGSRPSELAALEARLEQARAVTELTRLEYQRVESLHETNVVSENDYDRARLAHEQAARQVDELTAQLATARLGGRSDAIAAAEAEAGAARAAKERADWSVEQKEQAAPAAALIYDTLYREGEYVAPGLPVVALLPAENMKVRFFVPEADRAALQPGDAVRVALSGGRTLAARVSYLSPQPEYTPPVLYNRENRAKLVFMVEAVFEPDVARELHPGQPVDVAPGTASEAGGEPAGTP